MLTCAALLLPVYWILITALAAPSELSAYPPAFWPAHPAWDVFARVAEERPILLWLANSTLVAGAVVLLSMSVSILTAYSLSRFRVRGSHSLCLAILTAKMLPATLLVIPLFGIFRTLDLIGSKWSVILAHSTLVVPFSTWMLKGYFDTVPRELRLRPSDTQPMRRTGQHPSP